MEFKFKSEVPLYVQIIEHIKMYIVSGKFSPEDKLPSVRELSLMFNVNPNTIQKALAELENEGLIVTERTTGKYVTDNVEIIKKIRDKTLNNMIEDFYKSMSWFGLSRREVVEVLISRE